MSDFLAGIDCQVWPRLQGAATAPPIVRELFARDPERFTHCSAQAAGLLLDYSRQRLDGNLLQAFSTLAEQLGLRARTEAMFSGAPINQTEGRAVLHTALRRPAVAGPLVVEGTDLQPLILAERKRMLDFADAVRGGTIRSSKDLPFNLVINIGIGGSDLGPAMAVRALRPYTREAPRVEFVSNVDGCELADLLEQADPARTLFIICSKTFTTRWMPLAYIRSIASTCGTGSEAAIRFGPRSASHWQWPWVRRISMRSSPAPMRSMNIFEARLGKRICRCWQLSVACGTLIS
jgi:hypothetical protein